MNHNTVIVRSTLQHNRITNENHGIFNERDHFLELEDNQQLERQAQRDLLDQQLVIPLHQQQNDQSLVIQNQNQNDDRHDYDPFRNAVDFIEKLLILWLQHNTSSIPRKNLNPSSFPAVTFFFEKDKCVTVAVLSGYRNSPQRSLRGNNVCNDSVSSDKTSVQTDRVLSEYFRHRVLQGSAVERSLLYYELTGFIRPNYTHFCNHMKRLNNRNGQFESTREHDNASSTFLFDATIAQGALDESDRVQEQYLLQERQFKLERSHRGTLCTDRNSSHQYQESPDNNNRAFESNYNLTIMENALEIARLHRLQDDLDLLSIYCMRLASKMLAKVACRMARHYMMTSVNLSITPYVDGISLSDYSTFVRQNERLEHDQDQNTQMEEERHPLGNIVYHNESGNVIQYQEYPDIPLMNQRLCDKSCDRAWHREFKSENPLHEYCTFIPDRNAQKCFSWKCEEFILPNMHCRSLLQRDYHGQKLALRWHPKLYDFSCWLSDIRSDEEYDGKSITLTSMRLYPSSHDTNQTLNIAFDRKHANNNMGKLDRRDGMQNTTIAAVGSLPKPGITLFVHESQTIVDDKYNFNVTTLHHGKIEIQSVKIDFTSLVRPLAKYYVLGLERKYQQIEQYRPLLPYEKDYLKFVQGLVM